MNGAGEQYLIFTLQGKRYALALSQVAEVNDPSPLWPIPGAPSYYPGAMNFHGTIVAVLDLTVFYGLPSCHELEKVIVLAPQVAALALLVERVLRIARDDEASEVEVHHQDGVPIQRIHFTDGEAVLFDAPAFVALAADRINSSQG